MHRINSPCNVLTCFLPNIFCPQVRILTSKPHFSLFWYFWWRCWKIFAFWDDFIILLWRWTWTPGRHLNDINLLPSSMEASHFLLLFGTFFYFLQISFVVKNLKLFERFEIERFGSFAHLNKVKASQGRCEKICIISKKNGSFGFRLAYLIFCDNLLFQIS